QTDWPKGSTGNAADQSTWTPLMVTENSVRAESAIGLPFGSNAFVCCNSFQQRRWERLGPFARDPTTGTTLPPRGRPLPLSGRPAPLQCVAQQHHQATALGFPLPPWRSPKTEANPTSQTSDICPPAKLV